MNNSRLSRPKMGIRDGMAMTATKPRPFSGLRLGGLFRPSGPGLWLFLPIALVVGYLVIPPLFFIIYASLAPGPAAQVHGLTLGNYRDIFTAESDFKTLLRNPILLSVGPAASA